MAHLWNEPKLDLTSIWLRTKGIDRISCKATNASPINGPSKTSQRVPHGVCGIYFWSVSRLSASFRSIVWLAQRGNTYLNVLLGWEASNNVVLVRIHGNRIFLLLKKMCLSSVLILQMYIFVNQLLLCKFLNALTYFTNNTFCEPFCTFKFRSSKLTFSWY